MRERITDVAETTAALLNPDLIARVLDEKSEDTEDFKNLVQKLRKARNANRSSTWYVLNLYLMTLSPTDKKQAIFVADAEENPSIQLHYGMPDTQQEYSRIVDHISEPYSPPVFITDAWGTWLSGFAPIFDAKGNYLATVGADVSVSQIEQKLYKVFIFGAWGLLGSLVLSLISSFFLSRRITRSLSIIDQGMNKIAAGNLDVFIDLNTNDEFSDLAKVINAMIQDLKEREKMKSSFARYVSKHVLETVLKSDTTKNLEGERRKITMLFSDIRNFTMLSEKMAPESVVSILNEYFESMIDVIFKYQGTLDKFLGDGMMVEFGAPLEDTTQEIHALQAAVEMQQKLQNLCEKWKSQGKPELQMGIGIHTGYAVVGNIGSEKRTEYTAIGDTVNVASRLEKATKEVDVNILISQTTYLAVKDSFECKEVGPMSLPGRSEEIKVYSVSFKRPYEKNKVPG